MCTTTEGSTDSFDIVKLILSLLVVTIHIPLLPEVLNPVARMAVPLFFMMSSYFFWKKAGTRSKPEQKTLLIRFLKRNLTLYGFWFVILLPITLWIRNYFDQGILIGLLKLLQAFLFYSTFRASWYIIALCAAMAVLYWLSGRMQDSAQVTVYVLIHLGACLVTNYYGLISGYPPAAAFLEWFKATFLALCNNFAVAMLWIWLGKRFAEGKISLSCRHGGLMAAASFAAVCLEHFFVVKHGLQNTPTDYYVFLPSLCVGLFELIRNSKVKCPTAPILRKLSTVMYVLHSSALVLITPVCRRVLGLEGIRLDIGVFVVTAVFCVAAGVSIIKLEKHRYFRWLKWAY